MLHTRDATISIDNAFKRQQHLVPVLTQQKKKNIAAYRFEFIFTLVKIQ